MKNKLFFKVLLGLVIILVFGLGIGYFVGTENSLKEKDNTINNINDEENEPKEEYDYTSEEIEDFGHYLWKNITPLSVMILNGKEENFATLSMENLITLSISVMDYDEYRQDYCDYNVNCSEDYYGKAILKTTEIEKKFQYLFGSEKKLIFKDAMKFPNTFAHDGTYYENCHFENNLYICDALDGGGDSSGGYNYVYGNTEMQDDTFVLTIYGYSYSLNYQNDNSSDDVDEYKISSSQNDNMGMITIKQFEDEDYLNKFEKEHTKDMDVYKVTYKKDANGVYYWYQTDELNKW